MVHGFPKSLNLGLAIDKKCGVESKVIGKGKSGVSSRAYQSEETTTAGGYEIKEAQNKWRGWGTQLKPSFEPIIVARKPTSLSIVDNLDEWGVGGINIDECRVPLDSAYKYKTTNRKSRSSDEVFNDDTCGFKSENNITASANPKGRFPANTILTYSNEDYNEVCGGMPSNTQSSGGNSGHIDGKIYGKYGQVDSNKVGAGYNDAGSAARYFYCAKASKQDRDDGLELLHHKHNIHVTVKPVELMQYLVRLVTPKGGTILDPFMGSGSTGKATMYENKIRNAQYKFIGIELNEDYCKIAEARIVKAQGDILSEREDGKLEIAKQIKAMPLF